MVSTPSGRKRLLFIVLAVVAVAAVVYWFLHHGRESTDDAQIEGRIVTMSAKVPGYVRILHIADNQRVKAGDVLIEIDPRDYQLRLERAEAALDAVRSQYEAAQNSLAATQVSAPSSMASAESQVAAARAEYQRASRELHRVQSLDRKSVTRREVDVAVAQEATARSQLEDAQARLRSANTAPRTVAAAEAGAEQLAAQIKQAETEVAQAQKDLADTKIVAPADGRIAQRSVESGNYAQTGEALFSLVLSNVWVVANYKETQLAHMKPGQPVKIDVDAYPGLDLTGKVDSIQQGTGARFSTFPPENATGNFVKIVQRVPVKIVLDKPIDANLALGPGMSVTPTVDVR